jgi:ketosteroid isomerase-like protein
VYPPAQQPEDLDRFFVERGNAGDVEGLVALYEEDAVLAGPDGSVIVGRDEIRRFYSGLLSQGVTFGGRIREAIRNGDIALTSTTRPGDATVEVARRAPDGSWRWAIDQPRVLGSDIP